MQGWCSETCGWLPLSACFILCHLLTFHTDNDQKNNLAIYWRVGFWVVPEKIVHDLTLRSWDRYMEKKSILMKKMLTWRIFNQEFKEILKTLAKPDMPNIQPAWSPTLEITQDISKISNITQDILRDCVKFVFIFSVQCYIQ